MEGMLQMHLLNLTEKKNYSIDHIQKIIIDPREHLASIGDRRATEVG